MCKIGIDVGGTTIKCGVVKNNEIVFKQAVKTPIKKVDEVVSETEKLIYSLLKKCEINLSDIDFIGVGLPGTVHKNVVTYANNLDWYGVPFAELLEKRIQKKVVSDNDARCALYAELNVGAGIGKSEVLMVTLGTGVGTAFTSNGKVHKGFMSAGGEGGIMTYKDGIWEEYASTLALVKRVQKLKNTDAPLGIYLSDKEIDGKTIFDAEQEKIEGAKELIDVHIGYIADGIVSLVNLLRPQTVIIGGAIAKENRIITPLKSAVQKRAYGGEYNPKIELVSAKVSDAGIIGATFIEE